MQGILGKKLGMTQIYMDDGTAIPVTVVKAGPCLVVQVKGEERDGYRAVQIGLVEERAPRKGPAGQRGHFEKAGVAPMRNVVEVPIGEGEEPSTGDSVKCSIFEVDEYVDVTAKSKGKG